MSTGLNCLIVERAGEWFYVLEDWDSPKGGFSWLDYATGYGPFPSEEKAEEHLHANHANPGGHSVVHVNMADQKPTLKKLLDEAPNNTRQSRWNGRPAPSGNYFRLY